MCCTVPRLSPENQAYLAKKIAERAEARRIGKRNVRIATIALFLAIAALALWKAVLA